jgi:putative Flp pilus-assembly TadE/G-like protein
VFRRLDFRSELGQSLLVILLALPIMLGFMGLVVDGAHAFGEKRRTQNAADAAALAAAQNLIFGTTSGDCPTGPPPINSVKKAAECYSEINGGPGLLHKCSDRDVNGFPIPAAPEDSNCYTTPFKGNSNLVEVRLTRSVDEYFLDAIGLGGLLDEVSGRAVASALPLVSPPTTETTTNPGTTETVIQDGTTETIITPGTTEVTTTTTGGSGGVGFFKSTACPAISYTGSGQGEMGALVTNGGFRSRGTSNKFIKYLALGLRNNAGCFDNAAPAGIGTASCTTVNCADGPFAALDWPLAPPPVPEPPACHLLYTTANVTFRMRSGNVATLTTAAAHHLQVGDSVTVAGVQSTFNGTFTVTAVGSPTSLSYANSGLNVAQTASGGTITSGSLTVAPGWETTHAPGIYCAFGGASVTLSFSGPNLTNGAGYTFFAPNISVSGGQYKCYQLCDPAPNGQYPTLFYSSGDVSFQGNSPTVVGYIFAPNGEISFTGGGVNGGSGYMEAQTLKLAGNFASYTGLGPLGGSTTTTATTITPGTTQTNITPGTTYTTTVPPVTNTTTTPGSTTGATPGLDE